MHLRHRRVHLWAAIAALSGLNVCDLPAQQIQPAADWELVPATIQDVQGRFLTAAQDVPQPYAPEGQLYPALGDTVLEPTLEDSPGQQPSAPQVDAPAPAPAAGKAGCTKEKIEAAAAKSKTAFKGVFYANDFSYLNDPCYKGPAYFGDSLKGMADGTVDVGGETRVRYHDERNIRGLGLTGRDDEFWLTRYRMYSNWRINENVRFFGEYLYADSAGETFLPRPIEENRGEAQNLFLDVQLTDGLAARVGRQELLFGEQRLISPLDWANTRRTFDGYRGTYKADDWTIDGFFVHPVNRVLATANSWDGADTFQDFYGVYATKAETPLGVVDTYYLGLSDQRFDFDYHTVGGRVGGTTDGGTLYEFEGGISFGENSPTYGSHDAGFIVAGLGRVLEVGDWKPTVWAWYDYASGGDEVPAARGDDSFDHLFPLAHKYNGFMDLFGRRNLHDINAQFITPFFGQKVKMLLWYHYFLLDELTTPYSVVMTPFNPGVRAGDRELGHEIDLLFTVAIDARTSALVGYSHFNSGDYYQTTPGVPTSADADFFYFQYQWQF